MPYQGYILVWHSKLVHQLYFFVARFENIKDGTFDLDAFRNITERLSGYATIGKEVNCSFFTRATVPLICEIQFAVIFLE